MFEVKSFPFYAYVKAKDKMQKIKCGCHEPIRCTSWMFNNLGEISNVATIHEAICHPSFISDRTLIHETLVETYLNGNQELYLHFYKKWLPLVEAYALAEIMLNCQEAINEITQEIDQDTIQIAQLMISTSNKLLKLAKKSKIQWMHNYLNWCNRFDKPRYIKHPLLSGRKMFFFPLKVEPVAQIASLSAYINRNFDFIGSLIDFEEKLDAALKGSASDPISDEIKDRTVLNECLEVIFALDMANRMMEENKTLRKVYAANLMYKLFLALRKFNVTILPSSYKIQEDHIFERIICLSIAYSEIIHKDYLRNPEKYFLIEELSIDQIKAFCMSKLGQIVIQKNIRLHNASQLVPYAIQISSDIMEKISETFNKFIKRSNRAKPGFFHIFDRDLGDIWNQALASARQFLTEFDKETFSQTLTTAFHEVINDDETKQYVKKEVENSITELNDLLLNNSP